MKRDCTHIVERLPKHEERAGVLLKGVYAQAEQDNAGWQITIRCEAHAMSGDELSHAIQVVATLLDASDRVLDTSFQFLDEDSFFDFETIDLSFFDVIEMPCRIRLHPKRN